MNHSKLLSLLAQWDGEEEFAIMLANRPEQLILYKAFIVK
jgi:hypothetical protein